MMAENRNRDKILAVGYSVRHIVCSGSRAGYEMYAADEFGDVDTRRCAKRYIPLEPLSNLSHEIGAMDGIILGSGMENANFLFEKRDMAKIWGNPIDTVKRVSNKAWLATQLDDLNVPHPHTCTCIRAIEELKEKEGRLKLKLRYPVVVKPTYGGGGTMNKLCWYDKELTRFANRDFICQEYIRGRHASVSTLSTGKEVVSVAVNEQLIGLDSLHAPGSFSYCGNITPFHPVSRLAEQMCEIAEFLTLKFGLKGSNGFDFVISADDSQPFLIEVNPRFQGSLDTVELSTGLNLVDGAIKAVREGILPERITTHKYAVKLILYAERDMVVKRDLDGGISIGGIADIPAKGTVIRSGQPIASCIGVGDKRATAINAAMEHLALLKSSVSPLPFTR